MITLQLCAEFLLPLELDSRNETLWVSISFKNFLHKALTMKHGSICFGLDFCRTFGDEVLSQKLLDRMLEFMVTDENFPILRRIWEQWRQENFIPLTILWH